MSYAYSFQSYSFSHIVGQGHAIAYALAQRTKLTFPLEVWMESVPPDIFSFVMADIPIHDKWNCILFLLKKKTKLNKHLINI